MTREQFNAAMRELRLPLSARLTTRLLGVQTRAIFHYAAGTRKVPGPVAVIMRLLLRSDRCGVPPAAVDNLLTAEPISVPLPKEAETP